MTNETEPTQKRPRGRPRKPRQAQEARHAQASAKAQKAAMARWNATTPEQRRRQSALSTLARAINNAQASGLEVRAAQAGSMFVLRLPGVDLALVDGRVRLSDTTT